MTLESLGFNPAPRTASQIAAQIAVEAIANDPEAYTPDCVEAVIANGIENGVSEFYLDMLR